MSNAEEPKAGQWWLHSNGNVMFIAFDERTIGGTETIPILAYAEDLEKSWHRPGEFVRRLPDDAGFDWKPETWPKYYMPSSQATCAVFHRRDSEKKTVGVERNGKEWKWAYDWTSQEDAIFVEITKEEAEARIVKRKSIPEQCPDRWFIWSDNRYPIAFVKHDDGKVQNLNVDLVLKQSDDWHHGYEEQLTNGELVEVTEFSAKAFLKRPRSASQIPKHEPPKPKLIPVRLYWYDGNVVARYDHTPPTDPSFIEIKLDSERHISDSGFYVEGSLSQQ